MISHDIAGRIHALTHDTGGGPARDRPIDTVAEKTRPLRYGR
jgi:hypothetical protein